MTDEESMNEALERARQTGGADVFDVLGDEPPRVAAQGMPPGPKVDLLASKPMPGPVGPPPPMPPDVAPPPPGVPAEAGWKQYGSPPAADKAPDELKAQRLKSIENLRRMSESPPQTSGEYDDAKIQAAMHRDRQQVGRANLAQALYAAFARRAPNLQAMPSESDALMKLRQAADQRSAHQFDRKLSVEERIASALKGDVDEDGSLAQRRQALTEEAKNRLKLSQEQLGALEEDRLRKAGLSEREIEESIRHHKALEGAKNKATGPAVKVKPGDLSTVPEKYRDVVQAIADGRIEAPKAGSRFGADIIKYVAAYKPDFDATKFGVYSDVAKSTSKDATITNALTAKKHFQRAMEQIPANFDAQAVNRIANFLKTGAGSDQLTQFETDVAIGAGELSKGLGENAEAGKELVRHLLSPNQSKAQLQKRLQELIFLQEEGLDTKRERFESAAPSGTALPPILKREKPPIEKSTATVRLRNKKTGAKKMVPRDMADAILSAPGGDDYEEYEDAR